MKHKTSITIEEETILQMRELIRCGLFRNKSHVMDVAIQRLIKEVEDAKNA